MDRKTLVDFHCHSNMSDGYFSPEALAEKLAEKGVYYAALTDHDNLDGQDRFEKAATQLGIVLVTGLELFAWHNKKEIHILAYGFDKNNNELQASFGKPKSAEEAIRLVHGAGGKAFFAHPYDFTRDQEEIENTVKELKAVGLDGIEVYYSSYSESDRNELEELAEKHQLLISGGSDFHGASLDTLETLGVELPPKHWRRFRDAITGMPSAREKIETEIETPIDPVELNWLGFFMRIVLPALLTVGLFIGFLFTIVIPTLGDSLLARKREMIQELTNSAWSILSEYDASHKEGALTLTEAQQEATERIKYLRYGEQGKDYFWITDMHPRMIMHPYREDLNGQDLSDFKDPDGVRLFVETVNAVKENDHGYVDYVWQWKDDPERLVSKESYVRGFAPWGWVIGTGIYIEDVNQEIASITGHVTSISFLISLIVGGLLWFVAQQSLRIERKRGEMERDLRVSNEKYRSLVEAATEGTLVIIGKRCTYANYTFLNMLGYTEKELAFLELLDLLPLDEDSIAPVIEKLERVLKNDKEQIQIEAKLLKKDGTTIDAMLAPKRVYFAGQKGIIINVHDIAQHKAMEEELGASRDKYESLTQSINIGVFRAALDNEYTFLELNAAGRKMLSDSDQTWPEEGLHACLVDDEAKSQLFRALKNEGSVKESIQQIRGIDGTITTVSLSAVFVQDESGEPRFCDGIMEDISEQRRIESDRERMISQLQTSLLFLNEPIKNFMRECLGCPMDTPIKKAAQHMTRDKYSAIAVITEGGEVAGLVTDQDLRERVVAKDFDISRPIFEIMTSPVVSISDNAQIYEAFLIMRETHARHLLVKDSEGAVVGIARSNELFRFDRYSPVILTREIHKAESLEELVRCRERLTPVVSSLVASGVIPANICRTVTAVADSIVERIILLSIDKLGPPPGRFAFIAMGSEGREEQTLVTDQDNGIVYEDPPAEKAEEFASYFLSLGELISRDLADVGYALCQGNIMASNEQMNQSLSGWKESFTQWIIKPEAQELLQFNILFDFRCIYGDQSFTRVLRSHINSVLANQAPFFLHLARNTLQYKPPIGMLGQIVTGSSGAARDMVDIKEAMLPIVNFARLYALKKGIEETNTLVRLNQLRSSDVLREDNHKEIRQAYNYLMQLRFKHQVSLTKDGKEPDNSINPRSLSQIEAGMVKRALSEISLIQKKISFDFMGQG